MESSNLPPEQNFNVPIMPQSEPPPSYFPRSSNKLIIALVLFVILSISLMTTFFWQQNPGFGLIKPKTTACTMEAKVCPDGSSVGRQGPNCDFAKCPLSKPISASNGLSDWNIYESDNYIINYPKNLEIKRENASTEHVLLVSKDYFVNSGTRLIDKGYKVYISLTNGGPCAIQGSPQLNEIIKNPSDLNCLLADTATQVDYYYGDVKSEKISIDGFPGIKYEFVSKDNRNNSIGILIQKDDKFYEIFIDYRTETDLNLYNQILSTFKFTI